MAKLGVDKLPSIGTISLMNTYRMVNCTCLSDSGDLMANGMSDSTIKITWLNPETLKKSLSLEDDQLENLAMFPGNQQKRAGQT
jgi:hypothetical protein